MLTTGLLGFAIGVTMALTGAGGGILGVPALVFGLRLTVAQAGPVALFAVSLAAALGATLGLRAGVVRYRAAGFIALVGMIASPVGLWAASRVPNGPLAGIFGLVLGWVALQMLRRGAAPSEGGDPQPVPGRKSPPCVRSPRTGRFVWTRPCTLALAACGLLAGLLSGLLGVGGGFVIVPMLTRISDLPMRSIVATSLAVIMLVSASGVVYATLGGSMQWNIALPFAGGAVAGMLGGRVVANRITGHHLQQVFACVAAFVALAMLYKSATVLFGAQ